MAKLLAFTGKIGGTADVDRIELPLTGRLAAGGGLPMAIDQSKACTHCGIVKHLDEFVRNPRYPDGSGPECRDCRNARDRGKQWSLERYFKIRARLKLFKAIRAGVIVRPTRCSACSFVGRVEAHHENYDEPYTVQWFCKACHVEADKRRKAA